MNSATASQADRKVGDVISETVTVTDEMDLAPLATLGRKLNGHLQHFGRGGELFLADAHGNYLGRAFEWVVMPYTAADGPTCRIYGGR